MSVEFLILLCIGFLVGMFGTLVGVGGGFIVVPMLLVFYHATPQLAVGTSLCIVALNAISGSASYARQKRIDYRTGLLFAAATVPGAILGASLIEKISGPVFDVGFGIFLAGMSLYINLRPERKDAHQSDLVFDPAKRVAYNVPLGMFISFFVGFLSSMAGIGGGIVHVPAMIYLLHFPPFLAVSTSHFILALSTVVGALSHIWLGHVLWREVLFLGAGVVVGAQFGAALSHRIHTKWILRGLSFAIILVALRLIFKHL